MSSLPSLSLVVPVFKNEANLAELLAALQDLDARHRGRFEAVLVVDGSPDRSFDILRKELDALGLPSQLVLLARNFGAFAAIRHGLSIAHGDLVAVMAADLQEPPELVDLFYERLANDEADIAVGVRAGRHDGWLTSVLSAAYWAMFRRWVMPEIPRGGVDVFAVNRRAKEALLALEERNTSLIGQLFWVGFRRIEVPYLRQPRTVGRSSWSLSRRMRYMLDSVVAFTDLPLLALVWLGLGGVAGSLGMAVYVAISYLQGRIDERGYTPIMLSVLLMGSLILMGQGIVGLYTWRASENTKKRPLTIAAYHEEFGTESGEE